MIRQYRHDDINKIIRILQKGIIIFVQEDINNFINESEKVLVYESKNEINGFVSFRRWGENNENRKIIVYVEPDARRRGIGTLLYEEIKKYVEGSKKISTDFRIDQGDSTMFYTKHGYHKWYGIKEMRYNGVKQPESKMKFIKYQDVFFEEYVNGLRNSFYEMRKANDFRSYLCCAKEARRRLWEVNYTICNQ